MLISVTLGPRRASVALIRKARFANAFGSIQRVCNVLERGDVLRNVVVSYMDMGTRRGSLASSLRAADTFYMSHAYVHTHTWVAVLLIVCTYKRCSFENRV